MTINLRRFWALAALLASGTSASAGWDNVFQLTCKDCGSTRSNYTPPQADNCQPEARVSYVQRSYYQPVTEMHRESYYVPVKENVRTSYYEPVTSYKYSSYYDPCSGKCQEIAVPQTSYRLREQCNSVTKWVEKSRTVPVTSYRPVTMYQPVVTYYYPPVASTSSFYAPAAPPLLNHGPRVEELRQNPPAVIPSGGSDMIPNQSLPTTPQSLPRAMPSKPSNTSAAYTASRTKGTLRGEVVKNDRQTPRPNTKVVFINAGSDKQREEALTNNYGEFNVQLPAGEWYVYLGQGDGRAVFHKKLTVNESDSRDVTLVSR